MARIYIDFSRGIFEVEGKEEFVKVTLNDYKGIFLYPNRRPKKEDPTKINHGDSVKKSKSSVGKSGTTTRSASFVKSLDLSRGNREMSLKEFYGKKKPKSYMEKNVVFVYYLEEIAKLQGIGINHIYTCYKDVGSTAPRAFKQSIADTSSKNGWLDTSSYQDIKLSIPGRNYVLDNLPHSD